MPATADKLLPTSLDILRSALTRGVTGRLARAEGRTPSREVYVMQGQILAAHGPDDGPWVVRRLVNSGALTERQGKAFIRRLTRGIPFEELILGHVPDGLLEDLMTGRFRQNLLDFLSSPPPIEFQAMDTLFVANIQSNHDTRQTLQFIVELRERIGPLMRHRGPLTLCLGPAMPSSRQEARIIDLCDPPMPLRDLLTYSPFETGETLDCVMQMLTNGGLVSREGVRLQRPRGSGPTADYAVEELFALDGPPIPAVAGVPAAPIAPEHLALLREDSETPSHADFGQVPQAFLSEEEDAQDFDLPRISSSHLVLVKDAEALEAPLDAHDSIVPVMVEAEPSSEDDNADLVRPDASLFEQVSSTSPIAKDGDLLQGGGIFEETGDELLGTPLLAPEYAPTRPVPTTPAEADAEAHASAPMEEVPSMPPDEDSVPESWRDLSALGFEKHTKRANDPAAEPEPTPEDTATTQMVAPEPDAPTEDNHTTQMVAAPEPDAPTETHDPMEVPETPPETNSAMEVPEARATDGSVTPLLETPAEDAVEETAPGSEPMVAAREVPEDLPDPRSTVEDSPAEAAPPNMAPPVEHRPMPVHEGYDATDVVEPQLAGMARPPDPPPAAPVASSIPGDAGSEAPSVGPSEADLARVAGDTPNADDPVAAEQPFFMDPSDDAALFGDDPIPDEAPSPEPPSPESDPEAPPVEADPSGNALVDAARRYLEAANARQKTRRAEPRKTDPEYETDLEPALEPEANPSGVERKFTGFDFDVDDSEMAMFADHDHFRGRGQGQFTLNKNLLDKVELLPARKPDRVRMGAPEDLPPEDSIIEMGEATPEEEADAGVVSLAFSAPVLDADQVFYKISVGGDVARAIAGHFDATVGPGAGQTTVQLLVDAAASPFARLFHQVRVSADGSLDEEKIFENLHQRPSSEHRSLLDRGMRNFIERALSTAAEELSDEALDAVLNEIAGYQQRLRM